MFFLFPRWAMLVSWSLPSLKAQQTAKAPQFAPENWPSAQKERIVFQPVFFRDYVSFREGTLPETNSSIQLPNHQSILKKMFIVFLGLTKKCHTTPLKTNTIAPWKTGGNPWNPERKIHHQTNQSWLSGVTRSWFRWDGMGWVDGYGYGYLGGGLNYFLFSFLFGEIIQFNLANIFQMGWNHQLDMDGINGWNFR